MCASTADRDGASGITSPYNGQVAFTTDTNTMWQRQSGAWVPWYPQGVLTDLRQTAVQNIPNASFTALSFTTGEDADALGMHDPVTNNTRITFARTGRYELSGAYAAAPNASGSRGCVYALNGSLIDGTQIMMAPSGGVVATIIPARTKTIAVTAGQYAEIRGFQSSGSGLDTAVSASEQSSFTAKWVGP